jgi:CRISPR-associated protein (TIGR02710 family)
LQIITKTKQHSELFDDEDKKRLDALEHLIKGMHYWDLFNHESAVEELKQSGLTVDKQIYCLESLKQERITCAKKMPELKGNVPTPRLIVDILANAERRAEEGNYDDAIARLYRTIEMVAHFWLINKHKLNPSDIDLEKLKAINRDVAERYLVKKESEGKIQTALLESYKLLQELEPKSDIVKTYLSQEEKLKAYLNFRNSSILAHGCEPLDSEKYSKLKELAFILANSCVTNLESEILYVMNLFRNIVL